MVGPATTAVVRELVDNGLRHNDADDPWVAIEATLAEGDEHPLTVTVTDNGPGIPDHELAPIRAGDETAVDHGSGLGLWLVEWGVRQLNGRITFEDNDPRGTVATLQLGSNGRKQTGRFEQMLHTISNELVEEALENDCTHIVFEQLKGIRERLPHAEAVHKWAFHRLFEYVTYKAESEGLEVKQINPAYTSQRCSKCGFTHEDNRPHNNGQDEFGCQKCGYDVHADYNAAKNIGLKYLRDQQKSGRGGAPVGVRLNSGTLNVNGEYSPAPLTG